MSCVVYESVIVVGSVGEVWARLRAMDFRYVPTVKRCTMEGGGGTGEVGSLYTVEYKDGARQKISLMGLSDATRTLKWDVISSEPALTYSGASHTVTLTGVTMDQSVFVEWTCRFSRDASLAVTEDQRYKIRDNLTGLMHPDLPEYLTNSQSVKSSTLEWDETIAPGRLALDEALASLNRLNSLELNMKPGAAKRKHTKSVPSASIIANATAGANEDWSKRPKLEWNEDEQKGSTLQQGLDSLYRLNKIEKAVRNGETPGASEGVKEQDALGDWNCKIHRTDLLWDASSRANFNLNEGLRSLTRLNVIEKAVRNDGESKVVHAVENLCWDESSRTIFDLQGGLASLYRLNEIEKKVPSGQPPIVEGTLASKMGADQTQRETNLAWERSGLANFDLEGGLESLYRLNKIEKAAVRNGETEEEDEVVQANGLEDWNYKLRKRDFGWDSSSYANFDLQGQLDSLSRLNRLELAKKPKLVKH